MTEIPNTYGSIDKTFFRKIDELGTKEKITLIRNQIIPAMDARRGRAENMDSTDVHQKLVDFLNPDKPPEIIELTEEVMTMLGQRLLPLGINSHLASEFADIAYYGLQPNANIVDNLGQYNKYIFGPAKIPIDSILTFCIIKYTTRLTCNENSNYKDLEDERLFNYLSGHDELTCLWNPTNAIQTPDNIWEHVSRIR